MGPPAQHHLLWMGLRAGFRLSWTWKVRRGQRGRPITFRPQRTSNYHREMRAGRIIRSFLGHLIFALGVCFHGLVLTVFANLLYLKYWPQQIHVDPYAGIPHPSFVHGRLTLPYTDQHPVAQVASYSDELQITISVFMQPHGFRGCATAADGDAWASWALVSHFCCRPG